ncbi:MAG: hypothetical protein B7733_03835 [Myxococcales bacterium FL481]|nr:MAG: hypothetical protein B7733_03835 [Myxococcales bacterium FL481]
MIRRMLAAMLRGRTVLEAAGRYLLDNPDEVRRTVRGAIGLRFAVPITALRWLAAELLRDTSKVRDVVFEPCPPGLRVEASFDKMHTRLRGGADVFVDGIVVSPDAMGIRVRVERVALDLLEDASTPVAALLKADALDLSRPATLLGYLVDSPVLRQAEGDTVELDLLQHPRLAKDPRVAGVLRLLSALVSVKQVAVDRERVQVQLRGLPFGVAPAIDAVREQVVTPGWSRVRRAWQSARSSVTSRERSPVRRMLDAVTGQ